MVQENNQAELREEVRKECNKVFGIVRVVTRRMTHSCFYAIATRCFMTRKEALRWKIVEMLRGLLITFSTSIGISVIHSENTSCHIARGF